MVTYRQSRNIEASVVDALSSWLTPTYPTISILEGFGDITLYARPVITVRLLNTVYHNVEIGSFGTMRVSTIILDFFANNNGQLLQMKDIVLTNLKRGISYKAMGIQNGNVIKNTVGIAHCTILSTNRLNADISIAQLSDYEKYRYLISFQIQLPKMELFDIDEITPIVTSTWGQLGNQRWSYWNSTTWENV